MLSFSSEWDYRKDLLNQEKHRVSFGEAQGAFLDKRRIIAEDLKHSTVKEQRYFRFGGHGGGILTVRFTYRDGYIRIFGAGYWTKGKTIYEQTHQIHKGSHRRGQNR